MYTLGAVEDAPVSKYTRDNILWLNAQLRALKAKYGVRPDFVGADNRVVVWTPVKTLSEVFYRINHLADAWLDSWTIPDSTLQPNLINSYRAKLAKLGGIQNYEEPPSEIAAKGVPGEKVLTAQATYDFWYYAGALAIHFDILTGSTPVSLVWFLKQQLDVVLPDLPRPKLPDFSWIKWVAYATVGVLAIGALQKR